MSVLIARVSFGSGVLTASPLSRRENRWLRTALIEAALVVVITKGSALATGYRCIMRHRRHKKAIVAVDHAILQTAYPLLSCRSNCQDLGSDYIDRRHAERLLRRAVAFLEHQRCQVTLDPVA